MKTATATRIEIVKAAKDIERRVLCSAWDGVWVFGYRRGQALMNALDQVAPELYHILSGSLSDCFYRDDRIDAALTELGFDVARFHKMINA